jgi:plasmid stabilization system protein ParE
VLDVSVHAEARRDLVQARDYLDREPPGRGKTFVEAVEATIELIRNFPRIGKPLAGGYRRLTILGWDYFIIFQHRGDSVRIFAVGHKRQREDFWRARIV